MRSYAWCLTLVMMIAAAAPAGAGPPAAGSAGLPRTPGDAGLFSKEGRPLQLDRYTVEKTLRLSGTRLGAPLVTYEELMKARPSAVRPAGSGGGGRKIAVAVLASAILPGAGELYVWTDTRRLSHLLRAPVFMALDAYFWYSYNDNHDRGKEIKAEYEAFCDAHWSEERFLLLHTYCAGIGGCDSWEQYNEEARSDYWFFVYIPKELDREEYYENCGKYDAFAFGWDDWNGDYDNFEPWTPNRTAYWAMRSESDDYLVKGDQFVMLLIINRVVSMLDAGWLAYRASRGAYDEGGWSLDLRPGLVAPTVGVSYRF
ncbi:MAG: hypothetical protein PHQ19_04130 [Candidatus Krumholzibacteria bacterium]|nr:hypothetical protein [Candidatus Krumholzibacteria bacterium]